MKKDERIKDTRDFKTAYNEGQTTVTRDMVVYFRENQTDKTRIGISVSKRIGNAVKRNRIKRLIREAFIINKTRIKCGYDIVVIPRQPTKGKSFQVIEKTFIDTLKRAGLIINE